MKRLMALLILSLPLALPLATLADVYKWVDKEGVVHYSDSKPESGGNPGGAAVETLTLSPIEILDNGSVKNTGKEDDGLLARWLSELEELRYSALRQLAEWSGQQPPPAPSTARSVDLYTTAWCGYCKQAKRWLRDEGIPFKEYDVQKDSRAALRMRELGGNGGVPFALINGKTVVRGFNPEEYRAALR